MRELLAAAKKRSNWWESLSSAVPEWFDLFLALESGATEIAGFDAMVVPDLFQVTPYARAVVRGNPDLSDEQVEDRVALRTGRQAIFDRDDPPRLWAVLDESVLHRVRGDQQTMVQQYKHLLELSERPRVDIQVLPFSAGAVRAQDGGAFKVMTFPPEMLTEAGLVYLEQLTGGSYIEKPEDIAQYRLELARLRALAVDPKASREIIGKVIKDVA
jgi:hypothetical protein